MAASWASGQTLSSVSDALDLGPPWQIQAFSLCCSFRACPHSTAVKTHLEGGEVCRILVVHEIRIGKEEVKQRGMGSQVSNHRSMSGHNDTISSNQLECTGCGWNELKVEMALVVVLLSTFSIHTPAYTAIAARETLSPNQGRRQACQWLFPSFSRSFRTSPTLQEQLQIHLSQHTTLGTSTPVSTLVPSLPLLFHSDYLITLSPTLPTPMPSSIHLPAKEL